MTRQMALMLTFIFCMPATAQESISYVGESDDYLVFGLDKTKSRKGAIVSGWTEWKQFVEPDSGELGTVTKSLYSVECNERRLALRAETVYRDPTLSQISNSFQAEPGKENYSDVVPGSIGDSLLKWLCKPQTKKAKKQKAGA